MSARSFDLMPIDRRHFIRKLGGATSSLVLSTFLHPALAASLDNAFARTQHLSAKSVASDEEFWQQIQLAYTVSATRLDLNSGGVSPQPKVVQEAFNDYNRLSNQAPSYFMWRDLDRGRDLIRQELANLAGTSLEEIAITRNASESLENVILGMRLNPGDEVILSRQGYPNMIHAWKQRAMREGIVLKWLDFELPQTDTSYFVDLYKNAITPKTKVMHITHVINWNGQILPVKQITQLARQYQIETVVDGAHSFAQLDFKIPELGCDYFGTSLHKWLCAPFGTGMLYVKKEKIKNLYPLFAAEDPESDNIRKFENFGTRSSATEQAIIPAIQFHELIGIKRKQERLRYLKNYWVTKAKTIPGFQIHSPLEPDFGCGISLFSIDGIELKQITRKLINKHRIHVVTISWHNINGIRVSPNVFTLTKDLDRFVEALRVIKDA